MPPFSRILRLCFCMELRIQKARPLQAAQSGKIAYSAWIAPVGQTPSQAPQSTQEEASTTALSSMLIAPTGQVSTHAPQATHSLVTVWAIVKLLISVLIVLPYRPCTAASRWGSQRVCSAYCVTISLAHCIKMRKCHILRFSWCKPQLTAVFFVIGPPDRGFWARAFRRGCTRTRPACRCGGPGSPRWSGPSGCRPPR